jgi:hypothetical protein
MRQIFSAAGGVITCPEIGNGLDKRGLITALLVKE